jgi:hypothetical protein
MQNMKTVGQRILKLFGGQEKTDGRPDGKTNGLTDKFIVCLFVSFFAFSKQYFSQIGGKFPNHRSLRVTTVLDYLPLRLTTKASPGSYSLYGGLKIVFLEYCLPFVLTIPEGWMTLYYKACTTDLISSSLLNDSLLFYYYNST